MSSNTLSTHQLDRQAQQRLQTARQHASASGQAQGAAFQKLLMLAADEDTDTDGPQARGAKALLAGDTEDTSSGSIGLRGRANGRRTGQAGDDDTAALARGADSPAANAALMALLERASPTPPPAEGNNGATDALQAQAPSGETALASGKGAPQTTDTPPELALADAEDSPAPARPATGRSTRDLAQMLGAQQGGTAQGRTTTGTSTPDSSQTSQGAVPLADTSTSALQAPDPRAAQASDTPSGAPAAWAGARRDAQATEAGPDSSEAGDALGLDSVNVVSDTAPGAETRHPHGNTSGDLAGQGDGQPVSAAPDDTPSPQAEAWGQQWQDTMDQVAHQVSYWMGQGVHQANLRVASGAAQTLDVKLSLKGGKADLEFRTDHEQARQALNEGGTDVLRQWLAQGGIDLGQVSVGAGGTDGSGGDGAAQQQAGAQPRAQDAHPGTDGVAALPQGARVASGSSSGLDLYV
jgi:flagellar hook-length control protein FliK